MKLFINNLILKIIAIVLMSLYHVGLAISSINSTLSFILEVIGISAFPIFIFLLNEGLKNTSSIKKYFLRMFISSLIIYLGILLTSLLLDLNLYQYGNIFIDLSMYILIYYLFFINKNKKLYLLSILIFIYFIYTFLIKINLISLSEDLYKILGGLFPQYSLYGLLIFLIYTISLSIYDKKISKRNASFFIESKYLISKNIIYCIILALFSFLSYSFTYIGDYLGVDEVLTSYIILGSIFILFYNYKKGYKSKIISILFYLYYPIHLLIIYLIVLI